MGVRLVFGGGLNHVVFFFDLFLEGFRELDPVDDIHAEGQSALGESLFHGGHGLEGKGLVGNDCQFQLGVGGQVYARDPGSVSPDFETLEMKTHDTLDRFQLIGF